MAITPTKTTFFVADDAASKDLIALQVDVAMAFNTINTNTNSISTINTTLPTLAPLASPTFTGAVVVPTATASTQAVNLAQLQASIQGVTSGLKYFEARVVATTNVTLSGLQTIDDISLQAGDIALLTGQTSAPPTRAATSSIVNGPYVVASGAWTLAPEFATGTNVDGFVYTIKEGTTNGKTEWMVQSTGSDTPVTVGTTPITFFQTVLSLAQTNLLITNAVTAAQTSLNAIITANQATVMARSSCNYINAATTLTANQLKVVGTATSGTYNVTMILPTQNDEYKLGNDQRSTSAIVYALPAGTTYLANGTTTTATSISLNPGKVVSIIYNTDTSQFIQIT